MKTSLNSRVRRAELISLASVAAVAVLVLGGQAPPPVVETVAATRYQLLDGNGKLRAYLTATPDGGASLVLLNADGSIGAAVKSGSGGVVLVRQPGKDDLILQP